MLYPDPIHGNIELPDYVLDVVNTIQFQRLRNVKQLGACSYVFAGTNHSRFEHCIGVSYLVNHFIGILETNSDCRADEFYRKCVTLAGLMHDIGHGPYSHMWELFVRNSGDTDWTHENTSCDVVRYLIDKNSIRLSSDVDEHLTGVALITALISGDVDECYKILGDDHFYLSEIVNNKFCLIDVDKWDYMVRDAHYLRHLTTIKHDFERCFREAKVVRHSPGQRTHISFHMSTQTNIFDLFENRATLHKRVYQNEKVLAIEQILLRIFELADEAGFRFLGVRISEAQRHMHVYQHLDDNILQAIETSEDPRFAEAQKYIKILKRQQFFTSFDSNSETIEVTFKSEDLSEVRLVRKRHIHTGLQSMPEQILVHDDNDVISVSLKFTLCKPSL